MPQIFHAKLLGSTASTLSWTAVAVLVHPIFLLFAVNSFLLVVATLYGESLQRRFRDLQSQIDKEK